MKVFEIPDPSDTGTTLTYRLRSLATSVSEDKPYDGSYEITRWTEFCASCFSYKPNPPPAHYFQRHYYNDPWKDASLVKIIEFKREEEWEIAASTRVFKRTISTGDGGSILAGGIGEVCTSEFHRRRSLSKVLLHDAIETMGRMGMQASLLHASPSLQAVYERGGNYQAVTSRWCVLTIPSKLATTKSDFDESHIFEVRDASFPKDVEALAAIHKKYSESRFAGCIIRSEEYWTNYVTKELGGSLVVLTSEDGTLIGCLSLLERGGRYQLREFSVDEERCSAGIVMDILLKFCIAIGGMKNESAIAWTCDSFDLHLPWAVYADTLAGKDRSSIIDNDAVKMKEDDDMGWMYRPIAGGDDGGYNMVERVGRGYETLHLVWPTDSF